MPNNAPRLDLQIAVVITSTIFPFQFSANGSDLSQLSPSQRFDQTLKTIYSLTNNGVTEIYLVDNSGARWDSTIETRLPSNVILVKLCQSYPFNNKGIAELHMLLSVIEHLPAGKPIIKISGRYCLTGPMPFEFSAKGWDIQCKNYPRGLRPTVSTRFYCCINKYILEGICRESLREMFAYSSRIVGLSSLKRFLTNSINGVIDSVPCTYSYEDPHLMLETAILKAIKRNKLRMVNISKLGISGEIGSFVPPLLINE